MMKKEKKDAETNKSNQIKSNQTTQLFIPLLILSTLNIDFVQIMPFWNVTYQSKSSQTLIEYLKG